MLGVSFIVLLLALYSLISILRQENRLSFELLPIAVNSGSSLVVFAVYTQMEVFNIRIAMLIVEVYAYFLLTYGFVGMVFKESPRLRRQMQYPSRHTQHPQADFHHSESDFGGGYHLDGSSNFHQRLSMQGRPGSRFHSTDHLRGPVVPGDLYFQHQVAEDHPQWF
jgi:hypothetical protein